MPQPDQHPAEAADLSREHPGVHPEVGKSLNVPEKSAGRVSSMGDQTSISRPEDTPLTMPTPEIDARQNPVSQ